MNALNVDRYGRYGADPRSATRRSGATHQVAIVGCGFAGLFAAQVRRVPVEVTVIDRTNHHLFRRCCTGWRRAFSPRGDIAPPIRDILRRQHNAMVKGIGTENGCPGLTCRVHGGRDSVPPDEPTAGKRRSHDDRAHHRRHDVPR